MKRSEEDKVFRSSITVTLGGVEYDIEPLVIRDAREWRKKFSKLLGKLPTFANTTTDDPESFQKAVDAMLVAMPDEITDLFFAYAKDLDREAIESSATEAEVARAIDAVMEVAYPLLGSLTGALRRMSQ